MPKNSPRALLALPMATAMHVEAGTMKIELLIEDMPDSQAAIVAAKLGEAYLVREVGLERVEPAAGPGEAARYVTA